VIHAEYLFQFSGYKKSVNELDKRKTNILSDKMLVRSLNLTKCTFLNSSRIRQSVRSIYSIDGVFDKYLENDTMIKLEAYWRDKIKDSLPKVSSGFKMDQNFRICL